MINMAEQAAKKHSLDFTNVTESTGINPVRVPAGDYLATITRVTEGPTKNDESKIMWTFLFQLDNRRSATYPYYCVLQENQLWKVRNLLIACGLNVPKKKVGVDPNKVVGKLVGITLEDDEYEGKEKSVIEAIFPASELEQTEAPDDDDVDADTDADNESPEDDEGDLDLDDI